MPHAGPSGRHERRPVLREFRHHRRVQIERRRHQLGRGVRQPVGEGHLLVAVGAEDGDEDEVVGAGVDDVVAEALLDVADVAGVEVGGDRGRAGVEHGHPAAALEIVLPLVGVGVPVHGAERPGLDRDQAGGHGLGDAEVAAVGDLHRATGVGAVGRGAGQVEDERELGPARPCPGGGLGLLKRARDLALEDPAIVQRDVGEGFGRDAEVHGQDIGRGVRQPVGGRQGVELGAGPVVERQHELGPVGAQALQRVRQAGREVPQIAGLDVGHGRAAERVQHRDAAVAVGHDRPLGLLVPVQLADAAGRQAHVDAGDLGRDREVGLRHLPAPAAVLDPSRGQVERGPELRRAADVGRRRVEEGGHGLGQRRIVRPGDRQGLGIGDVDRPLRRQIRVAERRGAGRTRGHRRPPGRRRRQHAPARQRLRPLRHPCPLAWSL